MNLVSYQPLSIEVRRDVARALLSIGAVSLRPRELFTWASGIHSPIYCDNRLTLSYPLLRADLANRFAQLVKDQFPGVECIAGTATAGISHAALLADRLGLPMVYVRSGVKSHGKQNLVEGRLLQGTRALIVEDTVSTGGSVLAAVAGLRFAGAEVSAALAIFTYGFPVSEQSFRDAQVPLRTLTDFPALLEVAVEEGYMDAKDVEEVLRFKQDPYSYDVNEKGLL